MASFPPQRRMHVQTASQAHTKPANRHPPSALPVRLGLFLRRSSNLALPAVQGNTPTKLLGRAMPVRLVGLPTLRLLLSAGLVLPGLTANRRLGARFA